MCVRINCKNLNEKLPFRGKVQIIAVLPFVEFYGHTHGAIFKV